MPKYVLYLTDTDRDGDIEVHDSSCHLIKGKSPHKDLGYHDNCHKAVEYAKSLYPYKRIDGCKVCIPECHNR